MASLVIPQRIGVDEQTPSLPCTARSPRAWFRDRQFQTAEGAARPCRVQTTTKYGGFYEVFMGDDGAIRFPRSPSAATGLRAHAPEWDSLVRKGCSSGRRSSRKSTRRTFSSTSGSRPGGALAVPVDLAKPAHQPHLENFFDAIRRGTALTCPASLAYESAVAVLKVNEAVRTKSLVRFRPGDFKA